MTKWHCPSPSRRRNPIVYPRLRELTKQLKQTVPYYYGDFYPLTPYSLDQQDWIAWQFHVPDRDEGMVQAFRRSESEASTNTFRLSPCPPVLTVRKAGAPKPDDVKMRPSPITGLGVTPSPSLNTFQRSLPVWGSKP